MRMFTLGEDAEYTAPDAALKTAIHAMIWKAGGSCWNYLSERAADWNTALNGRQLLFLLYEWVETVGNIPKRFRLDDLLMAKFQPKRNHRVFFRNLGRNCESFGTCAQQ